MADHLVEPKDGDGPLTKKDFASDQLVRWCPGCGDYAILCLSLALDVPRAFRII